MHLCFVLFPLFDLSFVYFPSVLRYCWLGLLTCKNRLPYNLCCVGGDVKHCTTMKVNYRHVHMSVVYFHGCLGFCVVLDVVFCISQGIV